MMKKTFLILALTCALPVQAGWFDSQEVKAAKGARLNACPNVTLEQMVDSFLASPSWASFEAEGRSFVNIEGGLEFNEKPVKGLIQFELFEDDSLNINAFEMNEIAQNQLMTMGLIDKMCESAVSEHQMTDDVTSGKLTAKVLSVEPNGGEALKVITDKGHFVLNGSILTVDEIVMLEMAALNDSELCFLGTDTVYKDRFTAQCSE